MLKKSICNLGKASVATPLKNCGGDCDRTITLTVSPEDSINVKVPTVIEVEAAGPRSQLYFDPPKTRLGIVTCGGICPGINDVIRSIVLAAHHNYGVKSVVGFRHGLQGFIAEYGHEPVELLTSDVSRINQFGGTILGTSRGPQNAEAIVDTLDRMNVNSLIIVGGVGSMRAALCIVKQIERRNLRIGIVGVPKTIDNDVNFVTRSFGFDTAVEQASKAIRCAHVEALGVDNGVGLVKLMGRESGFIAAQAALSMREVNFVLVPELPFTIEGEDGLLAALERRLKQRGHAVIVCAEGAGQELCNGECETDASGNVVLADICGLLKKKIKAHFVDRHEVVMKYIDPSYIIRSVPANSIDRIYSGFLGQHAVHAAMAGKTSTIVTELKANMVHLPLSVVAECRRKLNTKSEYWRAVLDSTGQCEYEFCRNE